MSFADNIKAKIKDVDLEAQLTSLVDEGEQLVKEGVTKAGALAHDKRDDIDGWLGKATEAINTKTEGKYADQLTKLRTTLLSGVEKVAEHRGATGAGEGDVAVGDPIELPPVDAAAPEDTEPPAGASGPVP
ncbi:hypothetical protein [Nocardioides gilvus]|uniref:hypothetical protein n=1 Tax=Nocardioides gilvus TaxID=1735589 RepID=UPI000D74F2D8|nr:hypothetical protein [Nocardioides gilvus]